MIVEFQDSNNSIVHEEFQEWRRLNPEGFFLNCKSRSNLMLHFVVCQHHGNAEWPCDEDGYHSLTKKMKVCSTNSTELEQWAGSNSTAKLKSCSDCVPLSRNSGESIMLPKAVSDCYFFLWNPKKDPDSFENYDGVQKGALADRPYSTQWICPSTKPRTGDIAIVQRTGNQNNGVFAKGVVTDKPHVDDNGVRVVGLELNMFLPIGEEISREEIITAANYSAKWMPMASGNVIPEQITQAILSLWNKRGHQATLESSLPEEVNQQKGLPEGAVNQILVNAYERNAKARKRCIEHYGLDCSVCGFNFEAAYGAPGAGLIHVHHLKPLNEIKENYEVDPVKDLRPVCPNCHAIIHSRTPVFTIDDVKEMMAP